MVRLCTRDVDYVQMEMCLSFFGFLNYKLTRQVNVNLAKTCVELTNSGHTGLVNKNTKIGVSG